MGWVGGEHQTIRITDEDMHPLNEKIKLKKKKNCTGMNLSCKTTNGYNTCLCIYINQELEVAGQINRLKKKKKKQGNTESK